MSTELARQLLSLLIACTLVLAPVTGALAFVHPGEISHSTAQVHCPEHAGAYQGASIDDGNPQASDSQPDKRCCELPCGQCGHCPGVSLPSQPPGCTERGSVSFSPLPGIHAGHTPERTLRPPRSL